MSPANGQGIGPPTPEQSKEDETKYRAQLNLLLAHKSDSREIADAWENLGQALVFQHPGLIASDENEQQVKCFLQAVSAQRRQLETKKDYVSLARKLHWLGLSYSAQGKHALEKQSYEKMIAADEKGFGKNADPVALDLGVVESTYAQLKEWQNLRDTCKRELDIFSQTRPEDIAAKQGLLRTYAGALERLNQPTLAEKYYLESIALYPRISKDAEWRYGPSDELAALYVRTERYADAEQIYRRILSADTFPPDRMELLDVLEKQGKAEEALKICREYSDRIRSSPLREQAENDVRFKDWCSRCDSLARGKVSSKKQR
jgi:tetratricopeptide (TPR) repeat protein